MSTLAEIRAKLKKAEEAKNPQKNSAGDGLTFPFWDKSVTSGSTSVLRFLPDGDVDNTYFWRERQVIKLEFPGVAGHDEHKPVTIQVPCMEMWDETCPILTEIRPWFNTGDNDQEALARKYWKKRTYMFQGFVRESAVAEKSVPENPIRKFVVGPQIFGIIKTALMDPEMENIPTDFLHGIDFRLTKDDKGGFADYTKSSWSRRESPLEVEELEAIEKYGLVDLGTYLPAKPTPEMVTVIFEMFEASLAGKLYDPVLWGKYYKPYGLEVNGGATTGSAPAKATATVKPTTTNAAPVEDEPEEMKVEEVAVVKPVSSTAGSNPTAQEILAKIRSR